jgi:threonylcarbamoyladenosine tRNA methylthiotransferase MtaB
MRELGEQKRSAFIELNRGRILKGLIQNQRDRSTGLLKAVTTNYLTVLIEDEQANPDNPDTLKGKIVNIRYDQCVNGNCLVGQIVP